METQKNKVNQNVSQTYLANLKSQEFVKSFQRANQHKEMLEMADEGMEDYLEMIKD